MAFAGRFIGIALALMAIAAPAAMAQPNQLAEPSAFGAQAHVQSIMAELNGYPVAGRSAVVAGAPTRTHDGFSYGDAAIGAGVAAAVAAALIAAAIRLRRRGRLQLG
jgi:hypothetical protein